MSKRSKKKTHRPINQSINHSKRRSKETPSESTNQSIIEQPKVIIIIIIIIHSFIMSTPSSYRRVAQRDDPTGGGGTASGGDGSSSGTGVDTFDVPVRSRKDRLEDKCVALGWVIVACLVARYTDFFSIVLLWNNTNTANDNTTTTTTSQPNKALLRIAYIGFSIVTTLYLYLTIYLPKVKGLPSNDPSVWQAYCPKVLPIMGITGILTYLILIRAIYPIYGMLGPIISGTEIMGLVMATHFIPVFGLC